MKLITKKTKDCLYSIFCEVFFRGSKSFYLGFLILLFSVSILFARDQTLEKVSLAFGKSDWNMVKKIINKIDVSNLSKNEKSEYYFYLGKTSIEGEKCVSNLKKSLEYKSSFNDVARLELAKMFFLERENEQSLFYLLKINYKDLPETKFWEAKNYLQNKKYAESVKSAQKFIEIGIETSLVEEAYLCISESFIRQSMFLRALNTLQFLKDSKFAKNYKAITLFKIGFCYENLEDYSTAVSFYRKLMSEHRYTEYYYQAETRLYYIKSNSLADISMSDLSVSGNEKISTTEREKTKQNTNGLKFYLQAGAFGSKSNAKKLVKSFKKKGYSSIIFPKIKNEKNLQIVAVGPFNNKKDALSAKKILQKDKITTYIIERK